MQDREEARRLGIVRLMRMPASRRPVWRAAVPRPSYCALCRAGFKRLVKPSLVWGQARLNKDTVTRPNYKPAAAQSAALKEGRRRRKWDRTSLSNRGGMLRSMPNLARRRIVLRPGIRRI
jgi:hypothetical protein